MKIQTTKKMVIFIIYFLLLWFCFGCNNLILTAQIPQQNHLQTYIIHVEPPDSLLSANDQEVDLNSHYLSFLPTTLASLDDKKSRIVFSYRNVFIGFAARLSEEELEQMEKQKGFISAQKENIIPLHTTYTPKFLGLNQKNGLWTASNHGKGVIIGVLDSGITLNHPSFREEGIPPPPSKWKGKCQFNSKSSCNNKVIGARNYINVTELPVDNVGHGTHTASTAAGNYVKGANIYGNAYGTAAGIAPLAHLAVYKVCNIQCSESAILAALDDAIEDGVDILSLSLGGGSNPFYSDNVAIGAFSAMKKGIFVSCSAGNSGPDYFTVSNEAPWILTVGATTSDRKIIANAVLGNNKRFQGQSAYQPKNFSSSKLLPLIYPGLNHSDPSAVYCQLETLNKTNIKGKIVICSKGTKFNWINEGENVKEAGGSAMILINDKDQGYITFSDSHVLPATHLSHADGLKIIDYLKSTKSPKATITFSGTVIGDSHAPAIGYFSSRGPSQATPGILKPDILGPGVNILAAWPISVEGNSNSKANFNMESGTSMSCPHLSGVAALLKSAHPNWSPAAIKSAIMTTADNLNLNKKPIEDEKFLPADLYATGSGQVNPYNANNPGLVYDLTPEDYVPYLCGLGYTDQHVGIIIKQNVFCARSKIPEAQLNYPSFSVVFGAKVQAYTRTLTNVGEAKSIYSVKIEQPDNINIIVQPRRLNFSKVNQKITYKAIFTQISNQESGNIDQGSITWISSAKHSVRSPVVVFFNTTT